jgi:hypothetical protein
MCAAKQKNANVNARFLAAIDHLLITGIRLGPQGKQAAIDKVLQLVPEWNRGDCWRRIRQLRRNSDCLRVRNTSNDLQRPNSIHKPPRSYARRWTASETERLLNWAGYESVTTIAQRLGRSVRAVRFRLGALGISAKVSDGWSQRALRNLLRVSPARLKYLVGSGMLKVRDARVSASSLAAIRASGDYSHGSTKITAEIDTGPRTMLNEDGYPWERAADLLGVSVTDIQELICSGRLKLMDMFVKDRAFEDFCRKHGNEINMALMDRATAQWLISEYGIREETRTEVISPAQKHALITRTCGCGKSIAGNVFFKHVRHCPILHVPGGPRKQRVAA